MQIATIHTDDHKAVEFYKSALIHNCAEKMIFLIETKDIPEDESFIFSDGAKLQVIYGGGEDVRGEEIESFFFTHELAGASTLEIYKKTEGKSQIASFLRDLAERIEFGVVVSGNIDQYFELEDKCVSMGEAIQEYSGKRTVKIDLTYRTPLDDMPLILPKTNEIGWTLT